MADRMSDLVPDERERTYDNPARNTTSPQAPSAADLTARNRAIGDYRGSSYGGSNEDILRGAYTRFLGRDVDPVGMYAHLRNPGGLDAALGAIYDSEEARAYRNRPQTTPTAPPPTTTPPTTTPTAREAALTGWDQTKWGNAAHTTPKYIAGRIMSKYVDENGRVTDPAKREAMIQELLAAFPGSTWDGKDGLLIPSLGPKAIDILIGASRGEFQPGWQDPNVVEKGVAAVDPSTMLYPNLTTASGAPFPPGVNYQTTGINPYAYQTLAGPAPPMSGLVP